MFVDLWNGIVDMLDSFITYVLSFLPDSPIIWLQANESISQVLGHVNYFIPFYAMIAILEAWLVAISFYYIASIAMRWIKAVA